MHKNICNTHIKLTINNFNNSLFRKLIRKYFFREMEEMIEPMKDTLKEIDSNMEIQLDKIRQVKAQIMKNDQKIRRLLNGNL